MREALCQRWQGELLKQHRHKEAEVTKLRLDMQAKEDLIRYVQSLGPLLHTTYLLWYDHSVGAKSNRFIWLNLLDPCILW